MLKELAAGAAVCAAVAGCGSSGGGPKIHMTIRAEPTDTVVDAGMDLRGKAEGGDPQLIDVEADPYPFGSFHRSHSVPTNAKGAPFRTGDVPDVNTRYRFVQAVDGHAKSAPVTVYVQPRLRYRTKPARGLVHVDVKFGPTAIASRGPVYFYVHRRGDPAFRLAGHAPERPHGLGHASATLLIRASRVTAVFACSPTSFARGMGRPGFPVRHCGAPTVEEPPPLPKPDVPFDF